MHNIGMSRFPTSSRFPNRWFGLRDILREFTTQKSRFPFGKRDHWVEDSFLDEKILRY